MQEREPVIGGLYRHFKNKLYQVKAVAFTPRLRKSVSISALIWRFCSICEEPYVCLGVRLSS